MILVELDLNMFVGFAQFFNDMLGFLGPLFLNIIVRSMEDGEMMT